MRRELLIEKYISPTGKTQHGTKLWRNKYGESHSFNDQPAFISYWNADQARYKTWFKKGKEYRKDDKPSTVGYFKSGEVRDSWWYRGEFPYRTGNKPTYIECNISGEIIKKAWFKDGEYIIKNF